MKDGCAYLFDAVYFFWGGNPFLGHVGTPPPPGCTCLMQSGNMSGTCNNCPKNSAWPQIRKLSEKLT